MNAGQPLIAAVLAKIHEQLVRTGHLIRRLPDDRLDWTAPLDGAWPVGQLLGHLLECVAGICAVLAAAEPERLAHFAELRELPVNHSCPPDEAVNRLRLYRANIDEGFALLTDAGLARRLPTVFVQAGESILTLLLGNLEHLINHKHQLFMYLKLLGVGVDTGDLYQFRIGRYYPAAGAGRILRSTFSYRGAAARTASGRCIYLRSRRAFGSQPCSPPSTAQQTEWPCMLSVK